jgi:CRISPR-associated protein Csd1
MILQALYDYYHRKCAADDPAERLPAYGLELKEIPFVLEITVEGDLVQLRDTRSVAGTKKIGRRYLVPQGVKKASGIAANLLWDNLEYVTGIDTRGKPDRVIEQHLAFRARIDALPDHIQSDAGLQAVRRFLGRMDGERLTLEPAFAEAKETNAVMSFQLQSDDGLVCQRPSIISAAIDSGVSKAPGNTPEQSATCLVTGNVTEPERLHAAIKGVWGSQTFGANIVSFNLEAFESYGKRKRQGENAPIGKPAAFAYTTALNHMLRTGSRNRLQIGDASTVCWADQDTEFDSLLAEIFGQHDNPDDGVQAVSSLFAALQSGRFDGVEGDTVYYVLGLAPNAARISVRFFHRMTIRELAPRIVQHFDDLKLAHGPHDPDYPPVFRLLTACAVQSKAENIPPNLGGAILDAILAGADTPYPSLWLNAAINRCRAERNVSYFRAAAIKAYLNRSIRRNPKEKEFQPMLDAANTNTAYRLGRLFAVLEKIQEEASPGLNATIRDRYYGAASSTPVAVFTTLLRLKNAHLKKLGSPRSIWFEKLLGEVLGSVSDFPAHLALADQGRFALGYYHQRQAFFSKADKTESNEENN